MSNFDTPADIVADVLFRMDEPSDSPDFLDAVGRALVMAAHDFENKHAWPWDRKYPPGAFNTVAPVSDKTITIAAAGESVAATLSAVHATSLQYFKVLPAGRNWYARVLSHAAGTDALVLDVVPEALAAGTAVVIVKDEYQLVSDLGLFHNGLYTEDGFYVPLKDEERVRKEFGDKPNPAWPPSAFCRLDARRIRLSHYPTQVQRVEFPYNAIQADLDPTDQVTELAIIRNWRYVLSHATLYWAYLLKSDKRVTAAKGDYDKAVEDCFSYARKMMMGIGTNPGPGVRSPYS